MSFRKYLFRLSLIGVSVFGAATSQATPITHDITFVQTGPVVSGAVYVGSFDVESTSLTPSARIAVSNFVVTIEGNT